MPIVGPDGEPLTAAFVHNKIAKLDDVRARLLVLLGAIVDETYDLEAALDAITKSTFSQLRKEISCQLQDSTDH